MMNALCLILNSPEELPFFCGEDLLFYLAISNGSTLWPAKAEISSVVEGKFASSFVGIKSFCGDSL